MRRIFPLLAMLIAIAACAPARAEPLVRLSLVDRDSGQVLNEYPHRGDTWVAGHPGHRYSVRLTNTTGQRVLVVLSVDGVNAVSGQTASPSQAGYVLGPWETAEIAGWRKSLDEIAQFVFTDVGDSYAARTGRPDNIGVIGIAVFRERPRYRPMTPPVARAEAGAAAKSAPQSREAEAAADMAEQRIGTGHGQREWAPVGQTEFVRASRSPAQVSELRYDRRDRLVTLGVLPRRSPDWRAPRTPRAFPEGFVADPPGWR
ncbi:hypothetical protein CSC70_00020 [Pseudoxanthomonas kalamensis DSM 18571]|uniref:hypothetical protein n=1 Tax=Pseudoxanthomonas kalamensis TaxID=289483 RepID=UPI0013909DAA|nr:hypothetical protein [Pseudoxanthomonas kalamensis]KAF1712633.1 hypothetical protein CSC70_00020 [Pseudoxanthomonas kalamensis DSM 18571]